MWQLKNTFAIGGLENVGYAPTSDLLLVLSSQGEGIFDCTAGREVARSEEEWWPRYREDTHTILAFGPLERKEILIGGLHSEDPLPKETADGWRLVAADPVPEKRPFEKYLVTKIFLQSPNGEKKTLVATDGPCELRAFGFSPTGNSFVVALSCELIIWSRE